MKRTKPSSAVWEDWRRKKIATGNRQRSYVTSRGRSWMRCQPRYVMFERFVTDYPRKLTPTSVWFSWQTRLWPIAGFTSANLAIATFSRSGWWTSTRAILLCVICYVPIWHLRSCLTIVFWMDSRNWREKWSRRRRPISWNHLSSTLRKNGCMSSNPWHGLSATATGEPTIMRKVRRGFVIVSHQPSTKHIDHVAILVSAQNRRFFARVVQPHPNLWRFIQCLKQEESVISHRMVQTSLGFASIRQTKSTRSAARKSKQIKKLLHLLDTKQRSLIDIVMSFAYLVGEPVCRGKKGKKKKNNVSKSNSSASSSIELLSDS